MSDQINELAAALVEAQAEFPSIHKTEEGKIKGTNRTTGKDYEYGYKYADLATVVETVQPTLTKHGLAVSQHVSANGLKTYLLHKSGQFICDEMPLLLPKQDPQGQGSAITYARRYSYMAVLGLVADEDDDGNKASNKPAEAYTKPTAPVEPTISVAEAEELLALAKGRGYATPKEAADFLNALVLGDFRDVTKSELNKVKNMIALHKTETPF